MISRKLRKTLVYSCIVSVNLFLAHIIEHVQSANWAQVSGTKYQNANTNPETRWSPRWGHSAAALMLQRPEPCEYPEGTDLGLTEEPDLGLAARISMSRPMEHLGTFVMGA